MGSSCLGLCDLWICVTFSFIKLGKFSIVPFSNRFLSLALLLLLLVSLLYGYYYISCFTTVPFTLLHLSESLFLFLSFWVFFSTLSSSLLIQSSASSNLLLIPYTVFFNSEIVFCISSWLLLVVSMSFFMLL